MDQQPKGIDLKIIALIGIVILFAVSMLCFGPKHTLDGRYYYSFAEARSYLEGLSGPEKRVYLVNEIADLVFICAYSGLGLVTAFKWSASAVAVLVCIAGYWKRSSVDRRIA